MKIRKSTILFAFIFLGFGITLAQNIQLTGDLKSEFQIVKNDYYSLQVKSTLSDLDYFTVKTKVGNFTRLNAEGYGHSIKEGFPQLPVLKKIIEIPIGAEIEIRINDETYYDYDLSDFSIQNKIMPAQPPVSKSIDNPEDLEFIINQAAYQTDDFLQTDLAKAEVLGIMRSVRIARIEISPVQYNPVQNKIRVYTDLEIEFTFKGGDIYSTKELKVSKFSPYHQGLSSFISNYKTELTDQLITDEPVTYVIVSDPMFETALEPFIEWKTKKGFYVIEAYTDDPGVGTSTTSIHNYLQNLYNNPPSGYQSPSFVLFVGDVAQIPTYNGTASSHVTDLYYCEYTGDLFPECYYGRFSATNLSQLQPQIDKTLQYEKYLMPDPTFLDEVLMVAGDDESHEDTWGNGQINYGTTYYFNAAHGLYSHTFLQDYPTGNNGVHDSIIANMNDGIAYGNYTAHCSPSGWATPSFTTSDISGLTNSNKYPLLVGNCCSSLEFQTTCFGEEILRAANKGALGYIGGSNSTYWDEDFWWGVGYESISANPTYYSSHLGAYDRTFHDHGESLSEWYITQGQMPSAGNLAVTQAGSSLETYYWEIYHLMGDPSVMIYMSQPPVTTANYNALMPLGAATFTVNTQPYAYVGITKNGILHGAAIADPSGVAEVTMNPAITVPGTADVIVTRQNGQPFIGTVTVASPTGPYLSLNNVSVDDGLGNNNGEADYDENILLDVVLENLGSTTATNVSATISSADSYLNITDNSNSWPDIPAGNTSAQNGAFGLQISDAVPDQHNAELEINMTNGSENWNSMFSITINAPSLDFGNLAIDDVSGGNGNGRLDPGETADILVPVINNGHSTSPSGSANLSSISSFITVNSGSVSADAIEPGNIFNLEFNITCDGSTPIGTSVDLTVNLSAGNYGLSNTFYQSVGLVLEDWETGDFTLFPWTSGGNAAWTITNSEIYEGVYAAKSGTITDNQTSELTLILQTSAEDDISFYRKVSSESGYDYLRFYVDGVQKGEWSGTVDWSQVNYTVSAGLHTFKWVYSKDYSISTGSDCAWVDYIIFPPLAPQQPQIAVNPLMLDFGEIFVGETGIETFTISNTGTQTLTGSITAPSFFTVGEAAKGITKESGKNVVNFTIESAGSADFEIAFQPTEANCYNDNVYITSNDPGNPSINLPVTGCGVLPPEIDVNPTTFSKYLPVDGMAGEILTISNTGGTDLDYTASVVYSGKTKDIVNIYPQSSSYWTGSCTSSGKTQTSLVKALPPGEAGWMKFDVSSIPDGATINSIEFHGYVNYTYYPYWSMTPVSVDPVSAAASTLYSDIGAEANSGYYLYQNESSSYTTGWKVHSLPAIANSNLEAALTQDWFTVGIVSRDGSSTYYIYFDGWNEANRPYLVIDYSYTIPYSWLKLNGENQIVGTVASGSPEDINVGFDATGLAEGTYEASIYVNSNDPDESLVNIPVILTVGPGFELNLTVYLEGAFNGTDMNTSLSSDPNFPMSQPYGTEPWNYSGTENIISMPANIVDWVLVELRDAASPEIADGTTILDKQAGLLRSDGLVVGTDGTSPLNFAVPVIDGLYVVIYHRNHLGIISAHPAQNVGGNYNYDFSTGFDKVYGGNTGYNQLSATVYGMTGGEGLCDGQILMNDLSDVWYFEAGNTGYQSGDFNLDGQIDNKDKNDCWEPNLTKHSMIPE
ncbi:MAG: choice-of-anchor D domain-containing protein [Bacteroidales bacterium]|nr:choice-of-anchor D domain-containing protein [Bacteroidales bacterium]